MGHKHCGNKEEENYMDSNNQAKEDINEATQSKRNKRKVKTKKMLNQPLKIYQVNYQKSFQAKKF